MLKTEFVDDFADFYANYKEHIDKHFQDFSDTFGGSREINIDVKLFQHLIDLNNCNIFLLRDDEEFIGYVSVTISPAILFKGEVDCIIDHFYIVEEARGKGFANKVLQEIESQLEEDGVKHISMGLPEGIPYEAFANRAGYTKQSSVYSKKLGDN